MSIETAPETKRCRSRQLNKGSWTAWPSHDQPDPDRPRRRADGDRFAARRSVVCGRAIASDPAHVCSPATPASARPAARRAARPGCRGGLAGGRRALPGLRRQRAALPAVLRDARPARRPSCPRSSSAWPRPIPRWPGSSPAAGSWCDRARPELRRRGRELDRGRPVRRGARPAREAAEVSRCSSSSRTATGPTSRPATCSASCSRGPSRRRWRSSRPTAPTTCTAPPAPPSGRGVVAAAAASSGSQLGRCPTTTSGC